MVPRARTSSTSGPSTRPSPSPSTPGGPGCGSTPGSDARPDRVTGEVDGRRAGNGGRRRRAAGHGETPDSPPPKRLPAVSPPHPRHIGTVREGFHVDRPDAPDKRVANDRLMKPGDCGYLVFRRHAPPRLGGAAAPRPAAGAGALLHSGPGSGMPPEARPVRGGGTGPAEHPSAGPVPPVRPAVQSLPPRHMKCPTRPAMAVIAEGADTVRRSSSDRAQRLVLLLIPDLSTWSGLLSPGLPTALGPAVRQALVRG